MFFKDIHVAIQNNTLPTLAQHFDSTYSTAQPTSSTARGPRVRGHHTSLRREQKKRKQPIATNKGLIATSVLSGGEVIEKEGKRKHWRQFPDLEDEGDGVEMLDEEERVEGVMVGEGEVEMVDEVDDEMEQK